MTNIIAIENMAKLKQAKEIYDMIWDLFEDKEDWRTDEDFYFQITKKIRKEFLFKSDYTK